MINTCVFAGRLGSDPVLKTIKTTKGDTQVANFSLAVRQFSKDKTNDTMWVNVSTFGTTAKFVSDYLKKGQNATVIGEVSLRTYQKDGVNHTSLDLRASNVDAPKTDSSSSNSTAIDTNGNPSVVADDEIPF